MSLKSIANFVATEAAIPFTTPEDRAYLYDRINKAALEIYINNDLPNCLRECYLSLDPDISEIFTLPVDVYKVRGIRRPHYDGKNGMTFTGPVPRYQKQAWGNISLDNIRIEGQSATSRDIIEEQDITITISKKQIEDVSIVIMGDTAEETSLVTKVTIPAGSFNTTFSSPYTDIKSISKEEFFFSTVKGFEEANPASPLFEIPSALSKSLYTKVQIQDLYMFKVASGQYNFEMLYKPKLPIMYDENSEFIVPETYDQCIAWWTISQYCKTGDQADMYLQKVAQKLANINEDEMRGEKVPFNIGYNTHAECYDRLTWYF